jgi:hypothetical protein
LSSRSTTSRSDIVSKHFCFIHLLYHARSKLPADATSAALAGDLAPRRAFRRRPRKLLPRASRATPRDDQTPDGDFTHAPVKQHRPAYM